MPDVPGIQDLNSQHHFLKYRPIHKELQGMLLLHLKLHFRCHMYFHRYHYCCYYYLYPESLPGYLVYLVHSVYSDMPHDHSINLREI